MLLALPVKVDSVISHQWSAVLEVALLFVESKLLRGKPLHGLVVQWPGCVLLLWSGGVDCHHVVNVQWSAKVGCRRNRPIDLQQWYNNCSGDHYWRCQVAFEVLLTDYTCIRIIVGDIGSKVMSLLCNGKSSVALVELRVVESWTVTKISASRHVT